MAHGEELLAAVLATHGTAHLERGHAVPWGELEKATECDLTGRSELRSKARFPDADGRRTATPVDWLEELRRAGATRVGLLPTAEAGLRRRQVGIDGTPVDAHKLHAFAGTGGVVLSAVVGSGLRQFRTRIWLPPETTLAAADVIAFVAGRETADALRDALLWQDAHNLHVTEGGDWSRFVAALRPEHDRELVRAMDRVVSNTRFTHGEAEAWHVLRRERANPDCQWQVDFVRLPDGAGRLDAEPVSVQSTRLRGALVEIERFAREIGEGDWADAFRNALAALDGRGVPDRISRWFESSGLSVGAFRLLAASVRADVFGGMGSWNDLSPADRDRYDRVSADLFQELLPSLLSAVNEPSPVDAKS